jgi:hypothetical protein
MRLHFDELSIRAIFYLSSPIPLKIQDLKNLHLLSLFYYFTGEFLALSTYYTPNGWRYLRWGGDSEVIQLEIG